ncbi:hypothetical protein G7Y89_g15248 [Cudoniella acicularis]|uniref:Uncharacterized protein n=1 Tax=Cudoniella acicularis TaxID=354080 RepID=A0A8H4VQ14_9HELO|nr:hypothetical protein G7Y89_g15248 [Cudoniella acicularis]
MANRGANAPLLVERYRDEEHNGHEEEQEQFIRRLPATAYFKKAIRIMKISNSFFSLASLGLLIAAAVLNEAGPMTPYAARREIRELSILIGVNLLVSIPLLFLQIPIFISTTTNLIFSIFVILYSIPVLSYGWPQESKCRIWVPVPSDPQDPYGSHGHFSGPTEECLSALQVLRIIMGVGAGLGIFVGTILGALALFQTIAIIRTRFWKDKKLVSFGNLSGWKPKGFTVQFTFTILPQGELLAPNPNATNTAAPVKPSTSNPLIET